jgi:hypothetical protein
VAEASDDINEIVTSALESLQESTKDKEVGLLGPIEFELAVIKQKKAGGGFRILLADAEGKYSKESISRISFKITDIRSAWRIRNR